MVYCYTVTDLFEGCAVHLKEEEIKIFSELNMFAHLAKGKDVENDDIVWYTLADTYYQNAEDLTEDIVFLSKILFEVSDFNTVRNFLECTINANVGKVFTDPQEQLIYVTNIARTVLKATQEEKKEA